MQCIGTAFNDCTKSAKWIRQTQFAGDHPLCKECAKEDKNFKINDSYQTWKKLK